jgi:hypothetical protein
LNNDIVTICNSDPRVTPIAINLTEKEQGYLLEVTLQLKGTDQSSNMILSFDQKAGLRVQ